MVYFGCSSRVLEYEERESSCQGFCEGMSSSSVQQVQFPCAGCNSFLDHKDNSSTTATWGIGRPTTRSLLLLVCLHPHLHCTHQHLLQYTALLPRARPIEIKAPLRDQGRCKPSCAVRLSLYCLLLAVGLFCSPKNLDLIVAIYFEAN